MYIHTHIGLLLHSMTYKKYHKLLNSISTSENDDKLKCVDT